MAKGTGQESFADAINRAGERPDDLGKGAGQDIPNIFNFPIPEGERDRIIDDEPPPQGQKSEALLKGIPRYRLRAHFRRYIIGTVTRGFGEQTEFEEHDDSAEYEQLLNDMLQGKAIPRWEDRNVLKDGTVILAVSYLTVLPKKKKDGVETPEVQDVL
jgi:hypothetical protein